jgi:hypothetical protein
MQNLFDYLEWRGDLSFTRDGFNEADNLLFPVLAYLKFGGIVSEETGADPIPLFQAARQSRIQSAADFSSLLPKKKPRRKLR